MWPIERSLNSENVTMVEKRVTDGRRIAELLASELTARADGQLASLRVVDARTDVEATEDGSFAYGIAVGESHLASVFIHDDRARLVFQIDCENVRDIPETASVEDGATVKRVLDVIADAVTAWKDQ